MTAKPKEHAEPPSATKPKKPRSKPVGFDPRAVLESIAMDARAPSTARVAACKALLAAISVAAHDEETPDPITKAALRLLAKGRA